MVAVLLLGRSFHEVKKSSCASPVTAPTDTTQRDASGMREETFKDMYVCSLKFMANFLIGVQDECSSVSAPSPFLVRYAWTNPEP